MSENSQMKMKIPVPGTGRINPILRTDSYKVSHWRQYPPGTTAMFSYIEARKPSKVAERKAEEFFLALMQESWTRKAKKPSIEEIEKLLQKFRESTIHFNETLFFGVQMFLMEYLMMQITYEDIDEAEAFCKKHFRRDDVFNRKGWEYIVEKYNGYIPVTIKAVPEGMVIGEGNVLCTVECNDPKCFWIASYIESSLLRAIWYPCTVATLSRECKKIILKYLQMSSDEPEKDLMFKMHNFGDRGVSSLESSCIGDAGHLVSFAGTDVIVGILQCIRYYGADMPGYSVCAMEHSTETSWGREHEADAYRNMVNQFGKPGTIIACVSDGFDIFNACEHIWGEELRQLVIDSGAVIVIRPDSGDPVETVVKCLQILDSKFGSVVNKKGYKVLNYVRIIQGDEVTIKTIKEICRAVVENGFSMDNVNFGMGGALMQHINRDTLRFAMKCSAICVNGVWVDVYKDPVGNPMKKSKAGRISLYKTGDGNYVTMRIEDAANADVEEVLRPVFVNGKLLNMSTFDEVRQRASL